YSFLRGRLMTERDITEPLPTPLGGRTAAQDAAFRVSRDAFDIALGDLPFNLSIADERPYRRQTAPFRKEQVDTQALPGEQALDGWWLRSQSDFSGGAGVGFYEPILGEGSENRFLDSRGVNVFDYDDVRLLPELNTVLTGGPD